MPDAVVDRARLVERMSFRADLRAKHKISHFMVLADALIERDPSGVLVEAGCYQGLGTARLSHLADMLGRKLVVFDSFQGLPDHQERHTRSMHGRDISTWFRPGALAATLERAQDTVQRYGVPDVVEWIPGWFADTMPTFDRPVAGAYLDVDLAMSTRTCLEYLWPLLDERGVIVSQDGHLPVVSAEIGRWVGEADPRPSRVVGLGEQTMVRIDR